MEVRDAATVMLVRDDDGGGLEVFMLRRNLNSDFVGGAYVFPGGAVDEADRHDDLEAICDGRTDEECSALLGIERGGLAYWVAAVRECFEEAGVLLARRPDETVISFADPTVADRFQTHRDGLNAGTVRLAEMCAAEGLDVDAGAIHYFSHWITPEGPPRRYDTRFFVAAAPPEQVPLHDDAETIANTWIRPLVALDEHKAGRLDLIFPTIRNLQAIGRFSTAGELLDHAKRIESVPAILPRIVSDQGGMRILIPGDPGYDEAGMNPLKPLDGELPGRPGGPQIPEVPGVLES
jgi:8-oxo-dGTP pyrophosphatase MutT (NUDIX family)